MTHLYTPHVLETHLHTHTHTHLLVDFLAGTPLGGVGGMITYLGLAAHILASGSAGMGGMGMGGMGGMGGVGGMILYL